MHLRRLVGLAAGAALVLAPRAVRAQACCASTSTIFPARLQDGENALIGFAASVAGVYGSFDGQRVLHAQSSNASEIDLTQTLLVTTRVIPQLQVNVSLPFAETWRTAQSYADFGGGVSDMSLSARWDMLRAGTDKVVPGIALTASLTLPTGTPVELASDPLGADATGTGAAQVGTGVAFEQIFNRTLLALTGSVIFHGARTISGVHSQIGPDIAGTLGVSYTFPSNFALGAALTYMGSFDANIGGQPVADSARALTQVAISAAISLRKLSSRVLAALFFVPPISSVAQNEFGTVGASLTFIYGFVRPDASCNCPGGVCMPKM